jgi:methionine-rich copper-binding protein CopC
MRKCLYMKKTIRNTLVSWATAGMFIVLLSGCGGSNTPTDTTAPTIPTDVKAVVLSLNEIMLTWGTANDDVGVAQYEIYVGGYSLVSMASTTTTFLYTGLTPSTEYCCTVRAIDAAGNESALSDPPACAVTASVVDTTPPAAPTGLADTSSQNKIALKWAASAEAVGYKVYRDGVFIGTAQTASYVDTGLNASTPYCYTVTAIDAAGNESAASAPACLSTLAPAVNVTVPTVISTSPANHATNVQTDPLTISAVFSEAMNFLTVVNVLHFTVGGVAGGINYDAANFTVTFTPSAALVSNTTYTATISKDVMDVTGIPMGSDYVWSFKTAATPVVTLPTVIATSPADNQTGVALGAAITVVFSEAMAPLTVMNPGNFSVNRGVQGLVFYEVATNTATFTPSPLTPLSPATIYTGTISHTVTDLSGHQMAADYVWSFMTLP